MDTRMNATATQSVQVPTQYLTFMLGNDAYAMGILSIKEIIEYTTMTEVPLMPACVRGVINLRGAVVPVLDLQVRFGQPVSPVTKRTCIVIVEVPGPEGQQVMGVVVDAVNEVLEITESAGIEHLGRVIAVLTRLRLQGFGLSLDDYGTGFSSMQQLARLPFTELKIDRSFVHGAHLRSNLCVILDSALDMAKRLELTSVAEGIETLEDWRLLQQCGCNVGQGYLIGRPMPAEDIPGWLRSHRMRLPELRAPQAGSENKVEALVRA